MQASVSDLIGAIYDTTMQADLWPSTLDRIGRYVGTVAANVFWHDLHRNVTVLYTHGMHDAFVRSYQDTYVHLNPLYPAAAFTEVGRIYAGSDLVPDAEFRQTRFYREWVAPQNWIDTIGITLQRYRSSHACLALLRSADDGEVDEGVRDRMALLAPHIVRAVVIGRHIHRLEGAMHGHQAVLDAFGAGVFLLTAQGRLTFMNDAARALAEAGTVVTVRDGVLTSRDAAVARLLSEAASGLLPADPNRRSVSVPLTQTIPRWLADVLPLRSGNRLDLARDSGADVAIFVRQAEIPALSGIEIMARIYQLRASEVRVLHALTRSGGSNDELGEVLGISGATVKTHLKALFDKTGTGRPDELLREVVAHGGPLI